MHRLKYFLTHLEDLALIGVVLTMLGLALLQVVLRNLFGFSLTWVEPLTRSGLLWLALLGAMVGTRRNNHIRIDLTTRLLPERLFIPVNRLVSLVAGLCLAVICWHTGRLVIDEYHWGTSTIAGVREWVFQLIMPIGFGVMSWRFLVQAWRGTAMEQPGQ